jgi:hypothetical protein
MDLGTSENNDRSTGIDRRLALKKAAAAGAIAWAAPTIASGTVHAQEAACTPKCVPTGAGVTTTTARITCSGNGSRRRVEVTVPISSSILCPCSGENPRIALLPGAESSWATASITLTGGNIVVVELDLGRRPPLEVFVDLRTGCRDRSSGDGGCVRTCRTVATIPVELQDNGNCRGVNPNETATVRTTCS